MKLFLKIMIFIVVLACAGPFILKRSDGRPWMTFSDLKAPDLSVPDISPLTDQVKKLHNTNTDNSADQTIVYKWQDRDGVWHFSDKASTSIPSEEFAIKHNTNMVHMEKQEIPGETPRIQADENVVQNETVSLDPKASPYEQLPNLIDQAKNVEKLLDQHQQQQEQVIQQLSK